MHCPLSTPLTRGSLFNRLQVLCLLSTSQQRATRVSLASNPASRSMPALCLSSTRVSVLFGYWCVAGPLPLSDACLCFVWLLLCCQHSSAHAYPIHALLSRCGVVPPAKDNPQGALPRGSLSPISCLLGLSRLLRFCRELRHTLWIEPFECLNSAHRSTGDWLGLRDAPSPPVRRLSPVTN